MQTSIHPEKLVSKASQVATLQNNRHPILTDSKMTAAMHDIPFERA